MNFVIIFIISIVSILLSDLLVSFMMTLVYEATPYTSSPSLNQTYVIYVIAALLIAGILSLRFHQKNKNPSRKI